MAPGSAHPAFGLGALSMVGGLVGYMRKGSKPSLIAGTVLGASLIGSGVLISGENQFEGHALATATSSLMAVGMGARYLKTGKIMPAGIIASLGVVSAAYHAKKTMEWSN